MYFQREIVLPINHGSTTPLLVKRNAQVQMQNSQLAPPFSKQWVQDSIGIIYLNLFYVDFR